MLLLVSGAVLAMVASACGGTTTSAPPGSASTDPSSAASQPSSTDPVADFSRATEALNELDSYDFRVQIQAQNTLASQAPIQEGTTAMTGTVVNAPTKASTLHLVTSDKDGAVKAETEIVLIGETAYLRSGGAAGRWQQIPAAQAGTFTELMDSFRPERMFALYFVPIGTEATFVNEELRNGVASAHYRGGEEVGAILGPISGVQGSWSSDIWLAKEGGFLVASRAGVEGSEANGGGSFAIEVDITDVNSAGPIAAPI